MDSVDCIKINDYFSIKITRSIELSEIQEVISYSNNYSPEVDFFYHGLMSNNTKSKFLYFFTIIELLEDPKNYSKNSFKELLFSNEEITEIKKYFKNFDSRKKGIILNSLNTTKLTRSEKLFQYLEELNLECINTGLIQINDIKSIIDQRNKLYHSSEIFDNNIVYDKLFPLVREVVMKQLKKEK